MKNLMLFFIACFMASCGNTKNEKIDQQEAMQDIIDSTRLATQKEVSDKAEAEERERARRLAAKKEAKKKKADIAFVKSQIASFQADIAVEMDNLENIKAYRLLRTGTERENQLRYQLNKMKELNEVIDQWKDLMQEIKSGASYEMPQNNEQTDYQENANLMVGDTTL